MKKLHFVLSLCGLTLLGSLFTVLAANMFFGDIVNIAAGFGRATIPVTIPATMISVNIAVAVLYIIRWYKHPGAFKALSRLYLIYTLVFNVIGVVGVILSAILVYGTLVSVHPFPGYLLIFLVLHLLLIAGAITAFVFLRKAKEDTEKVKKNVGYVFASIGWFMFIMLMFNRFGTLLGAPTYIYFGNLYETFPFYIFLALPLFFGVVECLYIFNILNKKPLLIMTFVGMGLTVCLFLATALAGVLDSGVVSALSPAMPLERMASFPMEILIHLLSLLGVGSAILVQNFKRK